MAQTVQSHIVPAATVREVSGIVRGQNEQSVPGATVYLFFSKDTLSTSCNEDGIFIFKNVKKAEFNITVKAIGYLSFNGKYLYNETSSKIILDPIDLKTESTLLNEVKIDGKPSITYKTDTVEYRASDYKVRENANVNELLKKMEGIEVSLDGTLTHQGEKVTKARLNGKDFAGGDVSETIKNLPAEIVDKIQIIDDFGDQAARTGMKSGDPVKVLNITTRADKSVGNMATVTGSVGNNSRYDERLFAERLNGNEQLGVSGNIQNTVNGVANNTSFQPPSADNTNSNGDNNTAGSGGTTKVGGPSFNYRDQLSKTLQVNFNYRYNFINLNAINNTSGQSYLTAGQPPLTGTTLFVNDNITKTHTKAHLISGDLEFTPDSSNYFRIVPEFDYSGIKTNSSVVKAFTGLQNQLSNSFYEGKNTTPTIKSYAIYQHNFKNKRRNLSLQINYIHYNQKLSTEQSTDLSYRDSLQNEVGDLITHRLVARENVTNNIRASFTYIEPLSHASQLEFNALMTNRNYKNNSRTDSISPTGGMIRIDSLRNIFHYSFKETDLIINYNIFKGKYNLTIGIKAIPTHLEGDNLSSAHTTDRSKLYLVPSLRFQYSWSRQQQLALYYSGTPVEPSFYQLQPIPDISDPQNIIFGNPNLNPSFKHSLSVKYNNYIPNSKVNISANLSASFYQDQVVTNNILVEQDFLQTGVVNKSYTNQIRFVNLSGAHSMQLNYGIAKQISDRKYSLVLNGSALYSYDQALSNGIKTHFTSWIFSERFGPRFNPNEAFEINPFIAFELNRSSNSLQPSIISNYGKSSINLESKYYFFGDRSWVLQLNSSKNYVTGIDKNLSKNPFVVNAYLEKEIFARRNGILRVSAFDLFKQNNFINRLITPTGYTDIKSNALSRYVMLSFKINLQKWAGTVEKNGKPLKRRGDGSFIY